MKEARPNCSYFRDRSQTTFTRGEGRWAKKLTFLYHEKCQRRGVGGQKKSHRSL